MKVKICGITNLADAQQATDAGADFLGFIFYPPSKRGVNISEVRKITQQLRKRSICPVLVGVFVDETAEKTAKILSECDLDLAQLSGSETPSIVGAPNSPLYGRSYKVLHPTTLDEAQADLEWFVPPKLFPGQPTIHIDTPHATLPGGTGQIGEWKLSAELARTQKGLMLSGGLNPENIAEAIDCVHPFAVDVASGVEARPGVKDHSLVQQFIIRAKSV